MIRHEHHARYDFLRDGLWCPGCGRMLITAEWLFQRYERIPDGADRH